MEGVTYSLRDSLAIIRELGRAGESNSGFRRRLAQPVLAANSGRCVRSESLHDQRRRRPGLRRGTVGGRRRRGIQGCRRSLRTPPFAWSKKPAVNRAAAAYYDKGVSRFIRVCIRRSKTISNGLPRWRGNDEDEGSQCEGRRSDGVPMRRCCISPSRCRAIARHAHGDRMRRRSISPAGRRQSDERAAQCGPKRRASCCTRCRPPRNILGLVGWKNYTTTADRCAIPRRSLRCRNRRPGGADRSRSPWSISHRRRDRRGRGMDGRSGSRGNGPVWRRQASPHATGSG